MQIDLIVRGMCCLYPAKKGLSENISVTSIIGRYLEHSRIFWFYNDNNPKVFIGSADLMRRNLDRRIEAVTPIEDENLKKEIENILDIYLKDNMNSWAMKSNGEYIEKKSSDEKICAHTKLMELGK